MRFGKGAVFYILAKHYYMFSSIQLVYQIRTLEMEEMTINHEQRHLDPKKRNNLLNIFSGWMYGNTSGIHSACIIIKASCGST